MKANNQSLKRTDCLKMLQNIITSVPELESNTNVKSFKKSSFSLMNVMRCSIVISVMDSWFSRASKRNYIEFEKEGIAQK